jgi:hypothetical protein
MNRLLRPEQVLSVHHILLESGPNAFRSSPSAVLGTGLVETQAVAPRLRSG